jgi:hypothetical protein
MKPYDMLSMIVFALALPKAHRPDYRRAWVFAMVRLCERTHTASLMQNPLAVARGFVTPSGVKLYLGSRDQRGFQITCNS